MKTGVHKYIYIYEMIRVFERTGICRELVFVSASVWDYQNWNFSVILLRFGRRLRGAAPIPLALPYPFRTWSGSGMGAERDKREVTKNFVFWGGTLEPSVHLDACRA